MTKKELTNHLKNLGDASSCENAELIFNNIDNEITKKARKNWGKCFKDFTENKLDKLMPRA